MAQAAQPPLVLVTRPGPAGQDLAAWLSSQGFDALAWSPFALQVDAAASAQLVAQLRQCLASAQTCTLVLVSPTVARWVAQCLQTEVQPALRGAPGTLTVMTPGSGSLRAFEAAMQPAAHRWRWQSICPPDDAQLGAGDLQRLLAQLDQQCASQDASGSIAPLPVPLHVSLHASLPEAPANSSADLRSQPCLVIRGDYGKTALEQGLIDRGFQVQVHPILRRTVQALPDTVTGRLLSLYRASASTQPAHAPLALIVTSTDLMRATSNALEAIDAAAPGFAAWAHTQRLLSLHPRIVALAKQLGWADAGCVDGSDDSFLRALQSRS